MDNKTFIRMQIGAAIIASFATGVSVTYSYMSAREEADVRVVVHSMQAQRQHEIMSQHTQASNSSDTSTDAVDCDPNVSKCVWVNTRTGVYHQPGSSWYGATTKGRYMTIAGARSAGYTPSVNGQ